jgi:hypothetical protein
MSSSLSVAGDLDTVPQSLTTPQALQRVVFRLNRGIQAARRRRNHRLGQSPGAPGQSASGRERHDSGIERRERRIGWMIGIYPGRPFVRSRSNKGWDRWLVSRVSRTADYETATRWNGLDSRDTAGHPAVTRTAPVFATDSCLLPSFASASKTQTPRCSVCRSVRGYPRTALMGYPVGVASSTRVSAAYLMKRPRMAPMSPIAKAAAAMATMMAPEVKIDLDNDLTATAAQLARTWLLLRSPPR